jgi:hypothetical protein
MDSITWRFRSVYQCPHSSKSSLPKERTGHPLTIIKSSIRSPGQAWHVYYSCILAVIVECACPDRHHDWCLDRWTNCRLIWPARRIRCWGLDLCGRYCSGVYCIVSGVFLTGKMVNGIALGMCIATGQTYVSEIAPRALRGITLSAFTFFLVRVARILRCSRMKLIRCRTLAILWQPQSLLSA